MNVRRHIQNTKMKIKDSSILRLWSGIHDQRYVKLEADLKRRILSLTNIIISSPLGLFGELQFQFQFTV